MAWNDWQQGQIWRWSNDDNASQKQVNLPAKNRSTFLKHPQCLTVESHWNMAEQKMQTVDNVMIVSNEISSNIFCHAGQVACLSIIGGWLSFQPALLLADFSLESKQWRPAILTTLWISGCNKTMPKWFVLNWFWTHLWKESKATSFKKSKHHSDTSNLCVQLLGCFKIGNTMSHQHCLKRCASMNCNLLGTVHTSHSFFISCHHMCIRKCKNAGGV